MNPAERPPAVVNKYLSGKQIGLFDDKLTTLAVVQNRLTGATFSGKPILSSILAPNLAREFLPSALIEYTDTQTPASRKSALLDSRCEPPPRLLALLSLFNCKRLPHVPTPTIRMLLKPCALRSKYSVTFVSLLIFREAICEPLVLDN